MSRSMISAPESRTPRLAAAMLLLAYCWLWPGQGGGGGQFPRPLMEPLPLTMGVWYGEDFAKHEFFDEAKAARRSSWIVKTGQAQVQMWDTLLAACSTMWCT